MAQHDQVTAGSLHSKITMTLHTHPAIRLWQGRGVETRKPQIIGVKQFLFVLGRVYRMARQDDPYADKWLIDIEEKLHSAKNTIKQLQEQIQAAIDQIPEELSVSKNVSHQPFETPVFTGGPMGWQVVMLLIDFDKLARSALLANHIGLIGRRQCDVVIREHGGHAIRALSNYTTVFGGSSGATRDDFAANNARARQVQEKFGELPEDILTGKRRSSFAPEIVRDASGEETSAGSED
ncbi:PFL_4669 family integrating conjugative element protein [Carnimonas bestiolae]|uniref:PFL_4669 family integrating conjugative element protein n=1 Tax=Carnimonas bestiolae TaxID=3402172 RepID=UPI003EDC590B